MGVSGRGRHAAPPATGMWFVILALLSVLLAACTEKGGESTSEDKSKRPIGMSEEIWKIYGGAESGVMEDKPKDTQPTNPQPEREKK